MTKILKIVARYWKAMICILLLLFLQAFCDLELPEKTSNIINVGIQQSGIAKAVPIKIRAEEMQKLMFFMEEDQVKTVSEFYEADGTVLNLKEKGLSEKDKDNLNDIFKAPMSIIFISENTDQNSSIQTEFSGQMPDIETVKTEIEKIDDSILTQLSISFVKSEYQALGMDLDEMQTNYILNSGIIMLLYALITALCTIGATFLAARVAAGIARDLRKNAFSKVMMFSNNDFESFSTASLITRCTNDIQQVQMFFVMMLRMVLYAPIVGIGAFFKVLDQGTTMSWVIGIAVLSVLSLVIIIGGIGLPKFQIVQKLIDRLNLVSREILTGLPVIRAFSTEEREKKRFEASNKELTKTNLFVGRIMIVMMPTMMFVMNAISVLIVWIGASKIDMGEMQVGDLMAFISYTMQIIMAFLMLSMMSIMMPRAIISMKRIGEIFNKKVSINDTNTPLTFNNNTKGVIEFKNVSFRYQDAEEDILSNISFISKPGETTAFIGSTGSGKSTLINLIPRFYDVTEGEILIDGVNIKDVTLKDLRNKIGFVPQKATLFSGTIQSNISYSDENMSDEQIKWAAEIAQASEFIESKPEKYESEISQGGTNVSGGQKQRLSIARAIAKNPEILIFDDSFSALDFKTDAKLRKAISESVKESTILIVAQRISTVLNANQILVLDEGNVVGVGTHKELLKTCEVYKQIAYSQLSEEELNGKEDA